MGKRNAPLYMHSIWNTSIHITFILSSCIDLFEIWESHPNHRAHERLTKPTKKRKQQCYQVTNLKLPLESWNRNAAARIVGSTALWRNCRQYWPRVYCVCAANCLGCKNPIRFTESPQALSGGRNTNRSKQIFIRWPTGNPLYCLGGSDQLGQWTTVRCCFHHHSWQRDNASRNTQTLWVATFALLTEGQWSIIHIDLHRDVVPK